MHMLHGRYGPPYAAVGALPLPGTGAGPATVAPMSAVRVGGTGVGNPRRPAARCRAPETGNGDSRGTAPTPTSNRMRRFR